MSQNYSLMIHGGAGFVGNLTDEQEQHYTASITRILHAGGEFLASGSAALDVAEHCCRLLEDDPLYNAGKGAVLNADGVVEMDAAIMNGSDVRAGSVIGVQGVQNPIHLARLVMEQTEHVMLAGAGANQFAASQRVAMQPPEYFITPRRQEQLQQAKQQAKVVLDHSDTVEKKFGTVGVVVRDQNGTVAAATSTGGITNKQFGRVGDSPVIGAGVWADNDSCAVSCTGFGEQFLRTVLARYIADVIIMKGATAEAAAQAGIDYLVKKVKGLGGVIVIDHNGNCADAYSTEMMIRGRLVAGQEPEVKIKG